MTQARYYQVLNILFRKLVPLNQNYIYQTKEYVMNIMNGNKNVTKTIT